MSLSANTLIHFTASKENLKSILENNFKIFNCKETVLLADSEVVFYAPMVSFCDIPLSEIRKHISSYGNYGLGMTKEWGMKQGLNPILYVASPSMLSTSYLTAFKHFNASNNQLIEEWSAEQKALGDVLRYVKNYQGDLIRKGVATISNYRFSDEREWRYVPSFVEECDMLLSEKSYADSVIKAASEAKLGKLQLHFEPNDIKYIIIQNDSEISEFTEHLRRAKGNKYYHSDVERLTTRILTTEQIITDM